ASACGINRSKFRKKSLGIEDDNFSPMISVPLALKASLLCREREFTSFFLSLQLRLPGIYGRAGDRHQPLPPPLRLQLPLRMIGVSPQHVRVQAGPSPPLVRVGPELSERLLKSQAV